MPNRKVVVTGIGVVCGLGTGQQAVWESLKEGRSAIRPIQLLDMTRIAFKNGIYVKQKKGKREKIIKK